MALWVHHASRGVRRRCPRGGLYCCFPSGKGRFARAPLHSPRLCNYLAEGCAVALLLKCAGRLVLLGAGLVLGLAALVALWVHHASRGVRQRFPRGDKGARGRGPLCTPRAFSNYLAEGRAVALLLKGAGRYVPPSRSQHFVLPLAAGVPISAAYVCLSSCCGCTTGCCAFDTCVIRGVLGFCSEAFVRGLFWFRFATSKAWCGSLRDGSLGVRIFSVRRWLLCFLA